MNKVQATNRECIHYSNITFSNVVGNKFLQCSGSILRPALIKFKLKKC